MILNLDTPSEKQVKIARRAQDLRLSLHLKQSQLAERSGVTLSTLRRFEQSGEISLVSLAKIALALGVLDDLDTLFTADPKTTIAEMEAHEDRKVPRRVRK